MYPALNRFCRLACSAWYQDLPVEVSVFAPSSSSSPRIGPRSSCAMMHSPGSSRRSHPGGGVRQVDEAVVDDGVVVADEAAARDAGARLKAAERVDVERLVLIDELQEMVALGADVAHLEHPVRPELPLRVDAPLLHARRLRDRARPSAFRAPRTRSRDRWTRRGSARRRRSRRSSPGSGTPGSRAGARCSRRDRSTAARGRTAPPGAASWQSRPSSARRTCRSRRARRRAVWSSGVQAKPTRGMTLS